MEIATKTVTKKIPNPIDRHVGNRVRMQRILLNMSQEKLGEALGISDEPGFRATWNELSLELHAVQCLYRETARALGQGKQPDNVLSMLKIASTEHFQRTTEDEIPVRQGMHRC